MARDSQTVLTVTKLLLNNNYLQIHGDPDVLPIPWNEHVKQIAFIFENLLTNIYKQMFSEKRKLRIGYYENDGYFPTTPGIRRAVQIAKSKLEELGHELVPFVPPRLDYVVNSFISLLTADQSKYLLDALYVKDIFQYTTTILFLKTIFADLQRRLIHS